MNTTCPLCESDNVIKVLFYGLPHRLCESCSCLFGFWANITQYFPFNGIFLEYNTSYPSALFTYLTGYGLPEDD